MDNRQKKIELVLSILAISISIVALVLSILSYIDSHHQTEILDIEKQPILNFYIEESDNHQSTDLSEKLIISNFGSPGQNFKAKPMVFFDFFTFNEHDQIQFLSIPVEYYQYFPVENSDKEWVFTTGIANRWNKSIISFNKFQLHFYNKTDRGLFRISRYAEISYDDLMGKHHDDFYYIDNVNGARKLTNDDILRLTNNEPYRKLNLPNLDVIYTDYSDQEIDALVNLWIKIGNGSYSGSDPIFKYYQTLYKK